MDYWQIVRRIGRGVLRRRKRLALLSIVLAAGIFGPAAYYLSKEPPRFKTAATILLETRPDRVPLFQEFSPFRPLPVQLAILRSRSLAEGVIESLPKASLQDLIDNPYYVDYALEFKNAYRRAVGAEPEVESPQRRALTELQKARVNFVSRGDGIVFIEAEASKPQVAVDLANTYIEVLLSRTRSFNVDDARVSREFLEQQLSDVKGSLKASEEALRGFTASHGGVRIPERSQAAVTQLSQAENALSEVEANRKMVETRLAGLREKLEQQRRAAPPVPPAALPVAPAPSAAAPEVRRLRDQLAQLETTLLDLRTKYTEEHPRVVLVKDRISEVQRQLGSAVKESTPITPARTAVPLVERVNFAEQVLVLETSAHALSAQEEALRKQVDGLRRSLGGLSRSEMDYSRLTRELDSNRNLHALISDKLTAARIREQGEMKVVKVIDPPGFARPATSQKRIMFLAAGLLLALVAGAGVPVAAELINKRIESEEDVYQAIGLPVLAVIPRVRSRRPVFTSASKGEAGNALDEGFMFTEAFRNLRVMLQLSARADHLRSLMVASPLPAEGKSTVVMNLGLAFNESGTRVVVADTDFLRPTLYRNLKVPSTTGFGEVLQERRPIEESLVRAADNMLVAAPKEAVLPSMRGALATNRLKGLVDDMAGQGEMVLCDSAPVLVVPESLFLASAVDAAVLVAKVGSTTCRDLAQTKAALEGAGVKILGVVLNEVPATSLKRYYKHYYARYYQTAGRSQAK
jgi:capsular exopolysaccharide synthesis family protein